ncbi:P-loop containing nucleoside triphosphate hydrolase protein [Nemania abortiva]|nr:P-loop containing nucleoside triphosphate hydrolase protein [Nemania abortiva]
MERYIKLSEEEIDPETETQAKALLQSLNPIWSSLQSVTEESRATGLMAWAHLWTIYKPGDTAILKQEGEDDNELSAARILEVKLVPERWHRPPFYEVTFEVLDWNGSYSGYRKEAYRIGQYDGLKKLGDIGFYPFSYDSNPEKLKERLIRRGRKFESLRGYFFMTREAFNVTRRIIIDNYAYYRFKRRRVPTYARLAGHSDSEDRSEAAIQGLSRSPSDTGNVRSIHSERNEDRRPLTDDECLLCVPTMKGFDIQEKIWNNVQVEDIENITWNDEAFNQLAIQEDRKRLVLAFTKQKQTEATEFDDFISGKGKSFIILLCGPPGVGKTLTAESVAERTRAPLYTVSASDLGTYVASVESSLKEALELCALWKAVMLIDEADVFLEARTPDSLKRNELVSVFLRLLEYYKGILFLTTNRAATIDAAFESRIDLIIPYDDFDQVARRQVWDNFANGLVGGSHELRDEDLNELSRLKLNGREIKSTVKTALMLANSEEDKLQAKHLQVVLEVRQRAEDYLHGKAQTSSNSNGSTKAETGLFGRWKWGWRSVRT